MTDQDVRCQRYNDSPFFLNANHEAEAYRAIA
jgi:hypothetical protein